MGLKVGFDKTLKGFLTEIGGRINLNDVRTEGFLTDVNRIKSSPS